MSQSLAKNLIHLIYSTKHRERILDDRIREHFHSYAAGILKQWDSPALLMNSVEDHVHVLFSLSRTRALCDVVEHLKKGASKWLKTQGPSYRNFQWQSGYGAFSVSQSAVHRVKTYIADQKEHHRRKTFQEEFREFLLRHEIQFNERYVWD